MPALRRLFASVGACWLALGAELLLVAWLKRERLASSWELGYGALWLAPTALSFAAGLGFCGGLMLELVREAERPQARWVLSGLVAAAGALAGWSVGGGRHLANPMLRFAFAALIGICAASVAYFGATPLSHLLRREPLKASIAAGVLTVVLELLNRFFLVRLYPAWHVSLAALALCAACGLSVFWTARNQAQESPRKWQPWIGIAVVLVVVTIALFTLRPASARLAGFDNFRLLLLDEAPLLGHSVRAAALIAPPEPDSDTPSEPLLTLPDKAASGGLDLRGRDLLLVTIDALRADHVGAYGYRRPTTPNIDRLAASGVLFEYAYAPTPHTSYSVTSLMTGKYMRPLLMQGTAEDSDTWAGLLRKYDYRTAAFYPPAVFFIDAQRFEVFRRSGLNFEYRKQEFLEGTPRVRQVERYLRFQPPGQRVFVWVHLFGPHEPYEAHPGHDFGDRDIDRYDSEIADADQTVGALTELFRSLRPQGAVIVTADHGEEFGDHGGRYHGTTVYEEQVRVPLVLIVPGLRTARARITEAVQSIDLLPTVLSALDIPRPPRLRGRDLSHLVVDGRSDGNGFALAETDEQLLLATGALRLICARQIGSCALYDLSDDPLERSDISPRRADEFRRMRRRLQQLGAEHGRYEQQGLRAEGKGWPSPILRGLSGDADAATDIAGLLDDADPVIRREAAELLFELRRPATAEALELAVARDDDVEVRRWAALALTRLGRGATLTLELAKSGEQRWRRLAALALAETGDGRGAAELVGWWSETAGTDYGRSRQLLDALAKIREKTAVLPLVHRLGDVRLRPHIARTLAMIGDPAAVGPLVLALSTERYQAARAAIAEALVKLGAGPELAPPLVRFLGVPDALPEGLHYAEIANILQYVGGPTASDLQRLRRQSDLGVSLALQIPKTGNGRGVRALVRARAAKQPGAIHLSIQNERLMYNPKKDRLSTRKIPVIDPEHSVRIPVEQGPEFRQLHTNLPPEAKPGKTTYFVIYADPQVEVDSLAVVPLSDELPPPAPEETTAAGADQSQ